jgi:NADPH:quinone reductase-like Zn-dependent oxidoreductase
MREAAALPLVTITAWEGLVDRAKVHAGQSVLVHAGAGGGFDIVYDTVGGATLDASFLAAKRYTGHVVSALGWGSHSLAPLSFRGATYSGVFTLYPLIGGEGRPHHGEILAQASALVDAGKLRPLMYKQGLNIQDIGIAHDLVASGTLGKVVVEL